ncbi:alpha/beta hydrolase [Janthinobacterium agaricidamnosum]|uniref:Acetylesterase n=1 Tax=Janthinobacterium agaricidamnosum NBRC 102515 = DSM 9628 TaxID=1349767 RepID=W0V5H9_9BURK|nr:alpha/beta hydrolase [Janthinobacterium agaricidamnosum]CDG82507.1 acetylesterase [Janthinobacterium agaricidamnosum NBRC 102515 = DSM 9628]
MPARRFFLPLLTVASLAILPTVASAQSRDDIIRLWPGAPPDGPGPGGAERQSAKGSITNVAQPYLIVHRAARPNGVAVLVISGGGYAHIENGKESGPAANWLQAQGVSAFELVYRLPQEGWASSAVPFQDAQRAMRIIRSRAGEFGIDPKRIGVMGFSAGGHLAGMTAARPDAQRYAPVDGADRLSARPAFAALIYPVLTMQPPFNKTHSKKEILGQHASHAEENAYSVELQAGPDMPPTFLAQALDDPISPVDNSLLMFAALRNLNVPAEMHVFQSGGHGWGLGAGKGTVRAWPDLFASWSRLNGFWE